MYDRKDMKATDMRGGALGPCRLVERTLGL